MLSRHGKLLPPFVAKLRLGVALFNRSPERGTKCSGVDHSSPGVFPKHNTTPGRGCPLLQLQNFLSPLTLPILILAALCSKNQAPIGSPFDFSLANWLISNPNILILTVSWWALKQQSNTLDQSQTSCDRIILCVCLYFAATTAPLGVYFRI
jgi:hypothetical protein